MNARVLHSRVGFDGPSHAAPTRHPSLATCHRRPAAAFTLIEVVVSSAILALMMAILLSSMSASLSLWRVTEGKISADREGRSGHLLLAQDLANAVVPTNTSGPSTNLWPQITAGGTKLGFLTLRSADYQDAASGDVGDVCYVEYLVQSNGLYRRFVGSKDTFASVKNNQLPTGNAVTFQLLADNIIPNTNALKNTPVINNGEGVWVRTNFVGVIFSNSGGLVTYLPAGANRPDAIEVNFSSADRDAVLNTNLLALPNYQIRSAGFFTFRVNLPK
ncbi:MAG: PulJ/GspJ family protein [Chthoniobacterales bacterium]